MRLAFQRPDLAAPGAVSRAGIPPMELARPAATVAMEPNPTPEGFGGNPGYGESYAVPLVDADRPVAGQDPPMMIYRVPS